MALPPSQLLQPQSRSLSVALLPLPSPTQPRGGGSLLLTSRGCGWTVHVASQLKSGDHMRGGFASASGGSIYPRKLANFNAQGFKKRKKTESWPSSVPCVYPKLARLLHPCCALSSPVTTSHLDPVSHCCPLRHSLLPAAEEGPRT